MLPAGDRNCPPSSIPSVASLCHAALRTRTTRRWVDAAKRTPGAAKTPYRVLARKSNLPANEPHVVLDGQRGSPRMLGKDVCQAIDPYGRAVARAVERLTSRRNRSRIRLHLPVLPRTIESRSYCWPPVGGRRSDSNPTVR